MPRYDGTGPYGKGPMTGRGMGFCIVQTSRNGLSDLKGFAGIQGTIISENPPQANLPVARLNTGKEVSKMPGGDGTGPLGMGAMTGRAAGFCAGYGMPGYMNPIGGRGFWGWGRGKGGGRGFGRGLGLGFGRGRGWGAPYGAPAYGYGAAYGMPAASYGAPYAMPYAAAPTKEQELDMLKGQAGEFETARGDIRKRLQELETEKAE